MNGCELVVRACFDSAFAFEVYNHGALFGLQRVVPARAHQAVNHVVKRVVVVVEQNHIPVPVKGDFRQNVSLGLYCTGDDEAVQRSRFCGAKIEGHTGFKSACALGVHQSNFKGFKVFHL